MGTERLSHLFIISLMTSFLGFPAHAYAQSNTTNPSEKCLELGFSDQSKEYQECLVMLSPDATSVSPSEERLAAVLSPDATSVSPSEERLAAVQKIMKPKTDDAGEDEYTYGFRLWNAGLYPEAQQQLRLFVDQHPDHWRITYGRNLLGRAYLDDGKAREAAPWFLRNYQVDRQGARAADSLLHLAGSMVALNDTTRACIALREFADTYPLLVADRLRGQYESVQRMAVCG